MKRSRCQRSVVRTFNAVLASQKTEVVAVVLQAFGKPGVGREEEGPLQYLFAAERIANHDRNILPSGDSGDIGDVDRPGCHLTLRNEVAVHAHLHGRRKCDFGLERRGRILDEVGVHRIELGEAHSAERHRRRQIEGRREEIADRQAAQVGPIVVLRIGEQPGEAA